jgi:hypothetical protein
MNPRRIWLWLGLASLLFAFIFFYQRHEHKPEAGPNRILPGLRAAAVTSVKVRPLGQLEIRAERTNPESFRGNGTWRLREPITYPAQGAAIETLLAALEQLTPATYITARELRDRPKADEEYGFTPEQSSIFLEQPDYRAQIKIGMRTGPGDQVFLQVVGVEGVYVVDADLLKLIPRQADDWRDLTLISLTGLAFDRIAVTNGPTTFELQRRATNQLWRMVAPNQARANHARIEEALQNLQRARVLQFVPPNPKTDLEALGLQPPEWELALAQGTNLAALLQFGRSPTNTPNAFGGPLVYARRLGQNAVVTISNELVVAWRGSVNDFRDPYLVPGTPPLETIVQAIEVRGQDSFSLLRQTNDSWRVLPQNYPADSVLVKEMLAGLREMKVARFEKDVVIEQNLDKYGLDRPVRQYALKSAVTNSPGAGPDPSGVVAELHFGTNGTEKVYYARRTDERAVYAVSLADVDRLPSASWQMRARPIWSVPEEEVAGVTIHQHGKTRQLLRQAEYKWSLAPGSQGSIESLAVEETVRGLCHLAANAWLARGEQNRAAFGLTEDGCQISLELKDGRKLNMELARQSESAPPCAAVTLDGELWIFDLPPLLGRDVLGYLTIPEQ